MTNYIYVSPIHAPYHRLSSLSYFNLDQLQPAGTYYITCNCKVKLKRLLGYTRTVLESQPLRYQHFLSSVEIILVFLKSPHVNINDPKQLHLYICYKFNIPVMAVSQRQKLNK